MTVETASQSGIETAADFTEAPELSVRPIEIDHEEYQERVSTVITGLGGDRLVANRSNIAGMLKEARVRFGSRYLDTLLGLLELDNRFFFNAADQVFISLYPFSRGAICRSVGQIPVKPDILLGALTTIREIAKPEKPISINWVIKAIRLQGLNIGPQQAYEILGLMRKVRGVKVEPGGLYRFMDEPLGIPT